MRLCGRGVDQDLSGWTACLSQRVEQVHPHALGGPAHEAVVERLLGAIEGRRIDPAPADLRTWMMPEVARRSSTRGLPRALVGRWGAVVVNCSALNQN